MKIQFSKILTSIFFLGIITNTFAASEPIKDKATCESQGGRWGKVGIFPAEICNLPTKDANKICNDRSECEGTCIANLTKEQIEKTWRGGETIYTSGKCSAWKLTVGCYPQVRDGKVKGLFCQD